MPRKKTKKKTFIVTIAITAIIAIVLIFTLGFLISKFIMNIGQEKISNSAPSNVRILENPMKKIVEKNLDTQGKANLNTVVNEGIKEFNENYINYLFLAIGTQKLHKSSLGYGNPVIEMKLDNEVWSSEIINKALNTKKQPAENPDLRIILSKEEAVKALLSQDIKAFMKESVNSGKTNIEMIAGKTELFSKGYLNMYSELSG